MIMRELAAAGMFTADQEIAADELVPGWREMEPVEFGNHARVAAERILGEGAAIRRTIEGLEDGS